MGSLLVGAVYGENQLATPQVNASGPAFNNDLTAVNPIGGKMRWGNQVWRYVQVYAPSVVPVAGGPAYAQTMTPATSTAVPVLKASAHQADSIMGLMPIGVWGQFTTAPTTLYYTWIIVAGIAQIVSTLILGAGMVIGISAADGTWGYVADGTNLTTTVAGRVCGTSSGGLINVLLENMDW